MTTCKDCRFYKDRHDNYNGWCRAHPPAWDKKFETCNFPTVMADYWCGEFALRMTLREENNCCVARAFNIDDIKTLVNRYGFVAKYASVPEAHTVRIALLAALGIED